MRESSIHERILAYLATLPRCKARKTHGSSYSAGWPDIVGCLRGRMFLIEVKRPGEQATKIQDRELADWRLSGAVTAVVTSVDEVRTMIELQW